MMTSSSFKKGFYNDCIKTKVSLMIVLRVQKNSLRMVLKQFKKVP